MLGRPASRATYRNIVMFLNTVKAAKIKLYTAAVLIIELYPIIALPVTLSFFQSCSAVKQLELSHVSLISFYLINVRLV